MPSYVRQTLKRKANEKRKKNNQKDLFKKENITVLEFENESEEIEYHKKIINLIDEPLVKNKLKEMFIEFVSEDLEFKDEQIRQLEEKLKKLKEKKRAGCLLYNGKYVYFDKNGYALESYEKKYDDVPLVTGLKYDELVMQEKIPVKKEKVFSYLLELTTAIDKYNLPIDQIYIKEDGNALLISDKITVDLYNKKDIDIKISELAGMLKKVKGKSGTIDMKYFSEDHKIAVFQPKKS